MYPIDFSVLFFFCQKDGNLIRELRVAKHTLTTMKFLLYQNHFYSKDFQFKSKKFGTIFKLEKFNEF